MLMTPAIIFILTVVFFYFRQVLKQTVKYLPKRYVKTIYFISEKYVEVSAPLFQRLVYLSYI
jgi:hypothetical protein